MDEKISFIKQNPKICVAIVIVIAIIIIAIGIKDTSIGKYIPFIGALPSLKKKKSPPISLDDDKEIDDLIDQINTAQDD